MLYYLFQYLENEFQLPGASLFQFLSFRSAFAIVISLLFTLIFGKNIIKFLKEKQVGESIRVREDELWNPAVVISKHETPRSYQIRTKNGGEFRCNRDVLMKTEETNRSTSKIDTPENQPEPASAVPCTNLSKLPATASNDSRHQIVTKAK